MGPPEVPAFAGMTVGPTGTRTPVEEKVRVP
jgi:hypothetical protein